jgi:hypothetical protein
MTTGIYGQADYSEGNFYTPDWWGNWSKKNLKRKIIIFHRNLKQQEEY